MKKKKKHNIITSFFMDIIYGIYFVFYIISTPVRLIFKGSKKKPKKVKINSNEISGNVENNQAKIDKMFEKKKLNTVNSSKKDEVITVKKEKKVNEKKLEARKKKEELRKLKQEKKLAKIAQKKKILEQKKALKEEKRRVLLEKKLEEKKKRDEIRRQEEEQKKAILEEKQRLEEEKRREIEEKNRLELEKHEALRKQEEEKRRLEEEKKQAVLEEKRKQEEEKKRLEFEKREQERLKQEELKRLEQEKKEVALQAEKQRQIDAKRLEEEKKQAAIMAKLEKEKKEKEAKLIKEENEKNKNEILKLSRAEKKRERNAAKMQAKLDKKEAKLAKQRRSEAYINENAKDKPKPNGFKAVLLAVVTSPKKLVDSINKKYKNSLLYKNAQNKKDQKRQVLLINFDGEDAVKSEQKQVYEYVGKNAEGKVVKDYFPAYSRVEVHSFLLSEGFEVYSIRTSKAINMFHKSSANVNTKFKTKDLIFFLTQLSTYIKAGIPLVESLKILSRQFKKKNYQKIFRAMIYNLTMGDSFSIAMEKQGRAFPNLLINMIKASEMTGELPEALDDMAEYYTEAEATRKQMVTALTYPTIVFVFALGVVTFIMLYVVPKFVDIYNSMDSSSIPSFTLFVMDLSYFLQDNVLWIFLALITIIILFVVLYRNVKAFRWTIQWILMHLPVVKNIIIYNEVTMFTKTFASLLSHNVFITDTLEILSKITNNEIYKMLVRDTAANLERGEKISAAYKDQWAFPIPAYEMIVTGERTGQLSEMMSKVSTYYQDLHKNSVGRIKAFVEPVLIVGLAGVVGFIVLAIVIPMFNLYNQVI